jgi:hypothetical protein
MPAGRDKIHSPVSPKTMLPVKQIHAPGGRISHRNAGYPGKTPDFNAAAASMSWLGRVSTHNFGKRGWRFPPISM